MMRDGSYFHIRFKDGKMLFRHPGDADYFRRFCEKHNEKIGYIIVHTGEMSRSIRQNSFFHGPLINAFVELTGEPNRDYWKSHLKAMFLTECLEDGKEYTKATSDLSVGEMMDFIQRCLDYLADQGGNIPDVESWREWEQMKKNQNGGTK